MSAAAPGMFRDRADAGRRLAPLLGHLGEDHPIVIGLARGGVPVAAEVADALRAPLDVAVVRKVAAPQSPEFAVGAVAEGGVHVIGTLAARRLGLSEGAVHALIARADSELTAQVRRYRGALEPRELVGRTVVLVDDGLATGRSALAAIRSLRARGVSRVVLAVPVAAPSSLEALRGEVEEIVCLALPESLWAVGPWYEDFTPTSDDQVSRLLSGSGG